MKRKQIEIRRQKVWLLYAELHTPTEIAEKLGVSVRTVRYDLRYLQYHPEAIPAPEDEAFQRYVRAKLVSLLESPGIPERDKLRVLKDLYTSHVAKKIKKEEAKMIVWGGFEGEKPSGGEAGDKEQVHGEAIYT